MGSFDSHYLYSLRLHFRTTTLPPDLKISIPLKFFASGWRRNRRRRFCFFISRLFPDLLSSSNQSSLRFRYIQILNSDVWWTSSVVGFSRTPPPQWMNDQAALTYTESLQLSFRQGLVGSKKRIHRKELRVLMTSVGYEFLIDLLCSGGDRPNSSICKVGPKLS